MANLTVVVDEQVLLRARMRALQQGASVNAVLRRYLALYAARTYRQTTERLLELAQASPASSRGRLLSEDMQAGREMDGGQIRNPFARTDAF